MEGTNFAGLSVWKAEQIIHALYGGTAQVDVSKAKYLQDVRGHFCKPLRNNCSGVVLIFQLHENRVLSFILCLYVHVCV